MSFYIVDAARGGQKGIDISDVRVERGYQPDAISLRPIPAIEMKALGEECGDHRLGHLDKDLVRLDRMQEAKPRDARQPLGQPRSRRIGVPRVPQPEIVGEIGVELGAEKTHLGKEMTTALAAESEIGGLR